jgi:hypothetical protein
LKGPLRKIWKPAMTLSWGQDDLVLSEILVLSCLNTYYQFFYAINFSFMLKVRQIRNDFFNPTFLQKNEKTNWTLLFVHLFSFVFWKKVKTPKIHFKTNWINPNSPKIGQKLSRACFGQCLWFVDPNMDCCTSLLKLGA